MEVEDNIGKIGNDQVMLLNDPIEEDINLASDNVGTMLIKFSL